MPEDGRMIELKKGDHVTYTVPQAIRVENAEAGVDVSFRVNAVMKDQEICVKDGDAIIAHYKREHMAPGEMEHITLPKALLQKADGPLIVAVEEVPQS